MVRTTLPAGDDGGTAWRCYVALPPSARATRQLITRLAPLRAAFPGARWTAAEDLHVTLVFLGAVAVELVPAVVAVVVAVAAAGAPFRIAVRGAGEFGGRQRPRVVWLGIEEDSASMVELEAALRLRLAALPGLTDHTDAAQRVAHLTVARRAPEALADSLREAFEATATSWVADRVALYRSDVGRQGARHEQIVTAPIGGDLRSTAAED